MKLQWKMSSPVGDFYLVASARGLTHALWEKQPLPMAESLQSDLPQARILAEAVKQLEEYFLGERKEFTIPLDLEGTSFQKNVWEKLTKIPYGTTCSYKDIAQALRNQGAMRAVGNANGRNPVAIIVPCHRVIAADGSLGGYTSGLPIKTLLLNLEGYRLRD